MSLPDLSLLSRPPPVDTGTVFDGVPADVWMHMIAMLELDDDLSFNTWCGVNRVMSANVCDNEQFWQFACCRRGWNTLERIQWTKSKIRGMFTYKEHYKTWRRLVHTNESISEAVRDIATMEPGMTGSHPTYGNITIWDTSRVTNMKELFFLDKNFNQDISKWDTSNVYTMQYMFAGAESFNQSLADWNTSKVQNMSVMFNEATSFNKDISKWDTQNVYDMHSMFSLATEFDQDLSKWDTSNVKSMDAMFYKAVKFNQDISKWDTSNILIMSQMFEGAEEFQYRAKVENSWKLKERGINID